MPELTPPPPSHRWVPNNVVMYGKYVEPKDAVVWLHLTAQHVDRAPVRILINLHVP
jgi:hypothetical protein